MLHLIASTGRTATSFIAACLDQVPGVAGCHEGHQRNDDGPDLLPMINLENFQAFRDPEAAVRIVGEKRNQDVIDQAKSASGCDVVVDAAYYNATIGAALLATNSDTRVLGIVRDCESFVRSATWLSGEDPMPVGWPAPTKPLTARERFIGMGRIRPTAGPELDLWSEWEAIQRNVWLWRETNSRLCDMRDEHPDRVSILNFDALRGRAAEFVKDVVVELEVLSTPDYDDILTGAVDGAQDRVNVRSGGYQIPASTDWSNNERDMLEHASAEIETRLKNEPS